MESINDDCLRHIFKYLNLLEAKNVAETCKRLQHFVNDCIYPKSAKEIHIKLLAEADKIPPSSVDGIISLKDPFESFGYFVNQLSFVASKNAGYCENFYLEDIEQTLVLCPNLKSLSFADVDFIDVTKHVTPNLEEIRIIGSRVSEIMLDVLNRLSQLNSVTFIGLKNSAAGDLLKQNTALSSLTIDNVSSTEEDLMIFLNLNGRRLQSLKLMNFSEFPNFESIVTLIADKLPKLDNLSMVDNLSDILEHSLSKLPHLKFLKIHCNNNSVSALLRILSDRDTIEGLDISHFILDDNDKPEEKPLIFKQLRNLVCSVSTSPSLHAFLGLITKSRMPAIKLVIMPAYKSSMETILKFFESKKSLEKVRINLMENASAIPLLRGMIEILKAETNRPYLALYIPNHKIGTEEVSILNFKIKHKYCILSISKHSRGS